MDATKNVFTWSQDPVSFLNVTEKSNVSYTDLGFEGPPHNRTFKCTCSVYGQFFCGKGTTKKMAKMYAAAQAISYKFGDNHPAIKHPSWNTDGNANKHTSDAPGENPPGPPSEWLELAIDTLSPKQSQLMSTPSSESTPEKGTSPVKDKRYLFKEHGMFKNAPLSLLTTNSSISSDILAPVSAYLRRSVYQRLEKLQKRGRDGLRILGRLGRLQIKHKVRSLYLAEFSRSRDGLKVQVIICSVHELCECECVAFQTGVRCKCLLCVIETMINVGQVNNGPEDEVFVFWLYECITFSC